MRPKQRWPKGTWMQLIDKEILKLHMEHKGFSAGKLASRSDCSRGMIFHLTSGRKRSCSKELAERIAESLNLPVESLFVPNIPSARGKSVQRRKRTHTANGVPA